MRPKIQYVRALPITTLVGFLFSLALLIILGSMPAPALALVSGNQILTQPIPTNFNCTSGSYFIVFLNNSVVIHDGAPTQPASCSSLNGHIWSDVLGNGNDFHAYELSVNNGCTGRGGESDWLYCMSSITEFLEDQSTFNLQDSYPTPTPTSTLTPVPTAAPTQTSTSSSGGSQTGTINVTKVVVNDNGGTKVVSDFSLFVNGTPMVSGVSREFSAPGPVFTVTETGDAGYAQTFSGDCDLNGQLNLNPRDNRFCIVTNDDIGVPVIVPPVPPLIDVVKVPSPLALPGGPGPVTYTYTLRNIGTVPVTDITMVGDTCSPINLVSGDTNGDSRLDVTETWVYRCNWNLTETHTNTVVATGWANGISAVDIASSTVVVGALVPALPDTGIFPVMKLVPPLIHVTKVPSTLAFFAGGGVVVYTNKVTNPGVVALSNVHLTDDKCGPVKYISGDKDGDLRLDTNETWTYTCQTNITQTTTNTVTVSGRGNGYTVRDFAIATVVVATVIPALPSTGFTSDVINILWSLGALLVVIIIFILFYEKRKKEKSK